MTVGNKSVFAIESSITQAYERLSFRALGFFVIYLGGMRYGVYKPDATMLACSFDEVQRRIACRGRHLAPFATEPDAGKIATAFRDANYTIGQESKQFYGLPQPEFSEMFASRKLIWAPDGDEAFDDGSFVLHFDVGNRVRLIGFKCSKGQHYDSNTLGDAWVEADEFYGNLERWRSAFEAEWVAAPKIAD